MTIDEFIKELESKAELEKERAFYDAVKWNCITAYSVYCRKLESEYRQLAEWLKELKANRETLQDMKNHIKSLSNDPVFGVKPHLSISEKEWSKDAYMCGFIDVVDIIDRYLPELDIYDKKDGGDKE